MNTLVLMLAMSLAPQEERGNVGAATLQKRWQRTLLTVRWEDQTLKEVVRDLTVWLGVPFMIAPELSDREDEEINLELTNIRGTNLLQILKKTLDVKLLWLHGAVWITTEEDVVRRTAVLRMYDIRAMLRAPARFRPPPVMGLRPSNQFDDDEEEIEVAEPWTEDDVVDLLRNSIGESGWEFEGVSIQALRGRLVVRHTPAVQRKLLRILRALGA